MCVAGTDITYSVQLKSLGVTLDQNLSLDQYVGNIVKSSNFNIRALRHIRPMLESIAVCDVMNIEQPEQTTAVYAKVWIHVFILRS